MVSKLGAAVLSVLFLVAACSSQSAELPEPVKVILEAPDKARDAADQANERTKEVQKALPEIDE